MIGRWLSPDPYAQHWSPYLAMSNNPVSFIDPDGGYDQDWYDENAWWIYGTGGDDPLTNIEFNWGSTYDYLEAMNYAGGDVAADFWDEMERVFKELHKPEKPKSGGLAEKYEGSEEFFDESTWKKRTYKLKGTGTVYKTEYYWTKPKSNAAAKAARTSNNGSNFNWGKAGFVVSTLADTPTLLDNSASRERGLEQGLIYILELAAISKVNRREHVKNNIMKNKKYDVESRNFYKEQQNILVNKNALIAGGVDLNEVVGSNVTRYAQEIPMDVILPTDDIVKGRIRVFKTDQSKIHFIKFKSGIKDPSGNKQYLINFINKGEEGEELTVARITFFREDYYIAFKNFYLYRPYSIMNKNINNKD